MSNDRWIGVDWDGTLVKMEFGARYGPTDFGPFVPAMAKRVEEWLKQGVRVKIMTARAGWGPEVREAIAQACEKRFGVRLEVTNVKDALMDTLYDDRARQVEFNTGRLL